MDKAIEQKFIKDVKVKVAKFLYGCQNQSIGSGYMGLHVHSYVSLLWQNMRLDKLQQKYIEPACKEMIIEGHLIAEKELDNKISSDKKSRITLTEEGIFYYFYKDKYSE